MVEREQVERIELPVEQISYVPGPVDHLRAARRLWTATQRTAQAAADERARSAASSMSDVTVTTFTGGTTFRRLVDVPGTRLGTVLQAWWSRSSHDDGYIRLDRRRQDAARGLRGVVLVAELDAGATDFAGSGRRGVRTSE